VGVGSCGCAGKSGTARDVIVKRRRKKEGCTVDDAGSEVEKRMRQADRRVLVQERDFLDRRTPTWLWHATCTGRNAAGTVQRIRARPAAMTITRVWIASRQLAESCWESTREQTISLDGGEYWKPLVQPATGRVLPRGARHGFSLPGVWAAAEDSGRRGNHEPPEIWPPRRAFRRERRRSWVRAVPALRLRNSPRSSLGLQQGSADWGQDHRAARPTSADRICESKRWAYGL